MKAELSQASLLTRVSTRPFTKRWPAPTSPGGSADPSAEPSAAPGPSLAPGAGGVDKPPVARDELWVLVVLVVIAFLVAEWLVYHRDAVTRLWRNLRRGKSDPGTAGAPGRGR